jgi:DNA-binding NarL/FixJ family response regulator
MTREEAIDIRQRSLNRQPVSIAELDEAMRIIAQPERIMVRRKTPTGVDLIENPWNLSNGMCTVLLALCRTGDTKQAAKELGVTRATFDVQVSRAKDRMGIENRTLLLLAFDRFWRAAKGGVAA